VRVLGLLLAGMALVTAQQAGEKPKSAMDKQTLADYVRHVVPYSPPVTVTVGEMKASEVPGFKEVMVRASLGNVSEEKLFYVSNDGLKILSATVYDVRQHPFKAELDKLKTDLQPSMGTAGAPVVIVLFSDFQCGYCREEAKMLREKLLKAYPTQVRLYFKDYPLTQIHAWAKPAAVAGRCVFQQKPVAFWDYHDWVFENQASITEANFKEKAGEFYKAKSLNAAAIEACVAGKAAEAEVEKSMAEARSLMVSSTPTMFLNGRRLAGSVQWEALRQLIDMELGYQAVHKNAGENCCQVSLSPAATQK